MILHTWNELYTPAGQYTVPFSFLLDHKLPGSFVERHGSHDAIIQYRIISEMIDKTNGQKIKWKHPIIVRESLK